LEPGEPSIFAEIRPARAFAHAFFRCPTGSAPRKRRTRLAARAFAVRRPEISAGFKQFDYVNANAPKGGVARQIAIGTFDNFNMVVAGVKGARSPASTSSTTRSAGRRRSTKCRANTALLAEAVSYPDDFSSASYRLRAEANGTTASRSRPTT
jgi:ABC-type oligopeptide transport system substrate-binding subunit